MYSGRSAALESGALAVMAVSTRPHASQKVLLFTVPPCAHNLTLPKRDLIPDRPAETSMGGHAQQDNPERSILSRFSNTLLSAD
jgi:hypothetical protein